MFVFISLWFLRKAILRSKEVLVVHEDKKKEKRKVILRPKEVLVVREDKKKEKKKSHS